MASVLAAADVLRSHDIDPVNGFLGQSPPCSRLPDAYAPWETLAGSLNSLLAARNVRSAIRALPELSTDQLTKPEHVDRAMLLLSAFGHAYVWGEPQNSRSTDDEKKQPLTIPRCVSVPWCDVASRLDRPPVMSHASLVLRNWALLDTGKPVRLGNVRTLLTFLGGMDENWFYLDTAEIEAVGAPALSCAVEAQLAVDAKDSEAVSTALQGITKALGDMLESLNKMPVGNDPHIFYLRVRPFLSGWKGNPTLAGGVIYEGCYDDKPQFFHGGSAAQSSLLTCIDAVLGVVHKNDFMKAMLQYMPKPHRAFIQRLRSGPSVRSYVQQHRDEHKALGESYDTCLNALKLFRDRHIQIVALYIVQQAARAHKNDKKHKEVGTGGTSVMPFLKAIRDDVKPIVAD